MAKPLSNEERQQIIDLLPTGKSCRGIAKEVGRSPSTVGKIAKDEGHVFGRLNLERACEATRAYGKERRATFVQRLHEESERLIEQLHGKYLVYNFGGRDNTYAEHTLTEPPVDAKFTIMRAIGQAQKTALDILKYDLPKEGSEAGSDFDRWMAETFGAPE